MGKNDRPAFGSAPQPASPEEALRQAAQQLNRAWAEATAAGFHIDAPFRREALESIVISATAKVKAEPEQAPAAVKEGE